jgi:hypothetical protein
MNCKEPKNRKVSDAEVSAVILTAGMYFGENMETAISFVRSTGPTSCMLSESRFNRRMHRIEELPAEMFFHTGEAIKSLNLSYTCRIDSFPAAVCNNIRIPGCRTVKGREYRDYNASKRT